MEPKHTPPPWTIERIKYGATIRFWVVNGDQAIADCESLEDAEFIVLAVNAHEELVRALREIADLDGKTLLGSCCVTRDCNKVDDLSCELQVKTATAFSQAAEIAKQAIAKAEGK